MLPLAPEAETRMWCLMALPAEILHSTALAENQIETSHEERPKLILADAAFNDRPATTNWDDPVVGAFEFPTICNTTDTSYDRANVDELDRRIWVLSEYSSRIPLNLCCPKDILH